MDNGCVINRKGVYNMAVQKVMLTMNVRGYEAIVTSVSTDECIIAQNIKFVNPYDGIKRYEYNCDMVHGVTFYKYNSLGIAVGEEEWYKHPLCEFINEITMYCDSLTKYL